MNYIELINKFWLTSEAHSFRTTDIALFFYLLKINNACSWRESFKRKNIQIQADLDISFNTLKDSRNRLKQAELLDFRSKNGSGDVIYTLSNFDKVRDEVTDKVKRTSSFFDEVTNEVGNEVGVEVSSEVGVEVDPYNTNGTRNQTKLNKTKLIFSPSAHENPFPLEVYEKSLDDCYSLLLTNQPWAETVTMNTRSRGYKDFTLDTFYKRLKEYFEEMQNRGIARKSPADAMSHFANWLKEELKKEKDGKRNIWPDAKTSADIQSGGASQKDYSGSF